MLLSSNSVVTFDHDVILEEESVDSNGKNLYVHERK